MISPSSQEEDERVHSKFSWNALMEQSRRSIVPSIIKTMSARRQETKAMIHSPSETYPDDKTEEGIRKVFLWGYRTSVGGNSNIFIWCVWVGGGG